MEEEDFLALLTHGKHMAGEQGDPLHGRDRVRLQEGPRLHAGDHRTQATTEHHEPIKERFRDLTKRGLSFEEGILCVIDGSRGLRKAIREVFSGRAEVQRCQWHKRENIVSYLPKADQKTWRSRLQRAYQEPTYQEPTYQAAKERLTGLHADLEQINRKAARSLREGLEETLTLHRQLKQALKEAIPDRE